MGIKLRIKQRLFRRILDKRKRTNPFDPEYAEHFKAPSGADDFHNNSYYFSCHDMAGGSLLLRHAFRGQRQAEVWFAYRDVDGNAYINEKQLYVDETLPSSVQCIKTAKTWTFSYDGQLKDLKTGKTLKARFDGTFEATGDIFEFGRHLDSRVMAKAIAKEKWSKAFFETLRENDQVHYEQPGRVKGTLELGGRTIKCDYPAMRDHSFGKRDWNYMNRHFWLMALFEDGSQLNANAVSYPAVKLLQTGYLVRGGETVCVEDAALVGQTNVHEVPEAFSYKAKLLDGEEFTVACKRQETFVFPFDGGRYVVYEGVGTFEMNGKRGRGVLEFGFNSDTSRRDTSQMEA